MRIPLHRTLIGLLALAALLAGPLAARAATIAYEAALSPKSEVPPNDSKGTGKIEAKFDTESMELSWTVTYSGLSGPVSAAHFHGPAKPGENGGAEVPVAGPYTSPMRGTAKLTAAQAADLANGLWYLNVHTAAHQGGEVRGQLMKK
jgi:CHRD domain